MSSAYKTNLLAVFAHRLLALSTIKEKVDIEGPVALHNQCGDWGYMCRCFSWYVGTRSRSGFCVGRCRGSVFLVRCLGDIVKVNILLIDWSRLDNQPI